MAVVAATNDDGSDGEEEDYEYQDPVQLPNKTFRGNRLIGARAGEMKAEVPFIVLINDGEEFNAFNDNIGQGRISKRNHNITIFENRHFF